MAVTTTSLLPAPVQQAFSYKLLAVPVPNMIMNVPATRKKMDRSSGKYLRMRRYNPLPSSLVPLGNSGITPPSVTLSAVDIDAEIQWYGQYIQLNEQVTLTNQDPALNEAAARLGVSLRQTEDELTRNLLASSAAFIHCTGGVNGDNPTEMTRSDIDDVVSVLLGNNAYTILDNIEGEDKFGTAPVRASYFALSHTNMTKVLEGIAGFTNSSQYPSQQNVLSSEWGSVSNLRFLLSSIASVLVQASALNADVYNNFVVGMDAYTVIEQDGASAEFIYLPAQFSGPLAQNVSVGWKMAQARAITNDSWVLNLRSTIA